MEGQGCTFSLAVFVSVPILWPGRCCSQLVLTGVDYFRLPYGEMVTIAVTRAGPKLGKILGGWTLICTFFIGFVMFYIFNEDLTEAYLGGGGGGGGDDEERRVAVGSIKCKTAYNCMLWGLQNGVKGNLPASWKIKFERGGIPENFHSDNGRQLQWLTSMISFVMYRYSLSGILTATIVGVFRNLSKAINKKAFDTRDKCLICSLHRFAVDNYGGMYKHAFVHHNP